MSSARPRIFINGRFLEQSFSGVQRYAYEIVTALDRLLVAEGEPREDWCLLTTGREQQSMALERVQVRRVPSRLKGHAWEQVALRGAAGSAPLICLGGSGPVLRGKQLVVIHDASIYRNPQFFSAAYGAWHRRLGRHLARRARIGTVSRFSQAELASVFGLAQHRIPVLYNGSDHMARIPSSDDAYDRLELAGRPFFVIVGNLTPNKNVAVAVKALARVPDAVLVLVGGIDSRVFADPSVGSASSRALFAGRLPDADVAGLLGKARALIFPSLYEGFGIPPLEAMVRGCPVIASDIPPVREVCGSAANYFDPQDADRLAELMLANLAEAEAEHSRRKQQGRERAATFSWETSARKLLEFCREELLPGTVTQ